MNNRTLYLMLVALACGVMSAMLAHNLVAMGKVEALVPVRDLAPRQSLKDPDLFTIRRIPKEEIARPDPVTSHDQIKNRYAKAVIFRKDQPIYLDDTTEQPAAGGGAAAPPRRAEPPAEGGSLSKQPFLPAGAIGLTLPADVALAETAKVGDFFDLVLMQAILKEGEAPRTEQKPLLVRVPAAAVHRHRTVDAMGVEGQRVNALTFALRPQDAKRVVDAMGLPNAKVVPLPHRPGPAVPPEPQP